MSDSIDFNDYHVENGLEKTKQIIVDQAELFFQEKKSDGVKKSSIDKDKKTDKQAKINKLLERFIYIASRDRIHDTVTGKDLTRDAFSALFLHLFNNPKAATWFLTQEECIKVDDLVYMPGEQQNPVFHDNMKLWNIWRDPRVKLPENANDEHVATWLEHLNYLYPEPAEQQHILSWFAFILQFPQTKINHALLLAGTSRVGKDMLLNPLRYGLGDRNVCEPPAGELAETFTDYLHHTKLVIFQEIMNFDGLNLENKLKPMLASPPDRLRVRLFGRGFYETPNIIQAIFMSNYKDALHISEGDGRYFTVWTDVKPLSKEYYDELGRWIAGGGNGLVVRWLLDRDLSDFNPKSPAPMTQFKTSLIKISRSPLKHLLTDMIDAFDYPFNVDVVRSEDIARVVRDNYKSKTVAQVLNEIGCINQKCKRSTRRRETLSLFAVRNQTEWDQRSAVDWFVEYDARKKDVD